MARPLRIQLAGGLYHVTSRATLGEIPIAQRRPLTQPLAQSEAHYPRQEAMARSYLSGRHSMAAIALHLGVHYSTVSRAKSPAQRIFKNKIFRSKRNGLNVEVAVGVGLSVDELVVYPLIRSLPF